jgi:deoxyribodipyrimidine photolyase-related protein
MVIRTIFPDFVYFSTFLVHGANIVLLGVKLEDVVRWFSEVIAMDAYPWVMYSNIVSMGYFDTRFMQKPYVTSSAYLLKMSNYSDGSWSASWTALFYSFLFKKKALLTGGAATYLRNLAYFEKKKNKQEQAAILDLAQKFIKKVTR